MTSKIRTLTRTAMVLALLGGAGATSLASGLTSARTRAEHARSEKARLTVSAAEPCSAQL
jgi:hypothetical protein